MVFVLKIQNLQTKYYNPKNFQHFSFPHEKKISNTNNRSWKWGYDTNIKTNLGCCTTITTGYESNQNSSQRRTRSSQLSTTTVDGPSRRIKLNQKLLIAKKNTHLKNKNNNDDEIYREPYHCLLNRLVHTKFHIKMNVFQFVSECSCKMFVSYNISIYIDMYV